MNKTIEMYLATSWNTSQYALLDTGAEQKLERFGSYRLARPEPQAIWPCRGNESLWQNADARYSKQAESLEEEEKAARWSKKTSMPEFWPVQWKDFTFAAKLSPFKHTGIFPEQAPQWDWIMQKLAVGAEKRHVLNLFGYSGAATVVAARCGAKVTHVDASPIAIEWAKQNTALNKLAAAPVRWLVDDAVKFVRREARRGTHYDLVILDPPAFGRGPKGEVWKFETGLPLLLEAIQSVLAPNPLGIFLTSYSVRYSSAALGNTLSGALPKSEKENYVFGELGVREESAGRILSSAIFARWDA